MEKQSRADRVRDSSFDFKAEFISRFRFSRETSFLSVFSDQQDGADTPLVKFLQFQFQAVVPSQILGEFGGFKMSRRLAERDILP